MERFLRVTRDEFTAVLRGHRRSAARASNRPARCDLSAGIETDPRARTITIHLTRPDRDFLHKLTLPFAYVVPSDTPRRLTGDHAPPGTGPYRFAAWNVDRGGTLVRNPYFRLLVAPRPSVGLRRPHRGRCAPRPRHRGEIADVQRGTADLAVLADPFVALRPARAPRALTARSPGQLHSAPTAVTDWMFLNVRRPPVRRPPRAPRAQLCDRPRAHRRARRRPRDRRPDVPDRARPAFLLTSRTARTPPHASGRAGGRRPTSTRARRLVAQSGRAGARVVVWVPASERADRALLRGAARRSRLPRIAARARQSTSTSGHLGDPRTRAQIGFFGWSARLRQPLDLHLSRPSRARARRSGAHNISQFCDRRLQRQVDGALAAAGRAGRRGMGRGRPPRRRPGARRPADEPPLRRVRLQRVGNVQHHLQWFTLLDQLWVR